jgi:protein TonB
MMRGNFISDRFTVAIMLALGLHALVLIGISFVFEINPLRKAAETLDVVLVNWRSEEAPDDADFLAQANQKGGGESTEANRPSENAASAIPGDGEGDMPEQVDTQLPSEPDEALQEVISESPTARPVQQLTRIEQPEEERLSAAELMQQSMQIANLQPNMQRQEEYLPVICRHGWRKLSGSET